MKISVVGLGKLGACMAACLASKGYSVVGVDCNPTAIRLLNSGQPPIFEPGLGERTARAGGRLSATSDYGQAVSESEITFIVVPTPSEDHGGFSLRYVKQAAREIARALKDKSAYHLVVLTSTVLPGSSEFGVIPLLEGASNKRCGADFGFCYGPEFIALGSVIRDFLNPDFVLIGEFDRRSGDVLANLYQRVCDNHPPIARLSLINAELAKIAINSYVTMKITFANMLAALCEELPGGDIDEVTQALGLDTRIGPRYLRGALGYGGPCFPRDNLALAYLASQLGLRTPLAEATDAYNRTIVDRIADRIASLAPTDGRIAVLGLSYKPDTSVVEESQGLQLAERLAAQGLRTIVYDPLAMENARAVLGSSAQYAHSLEQCAHEADLLVIANPDKAFMRLLTGSGPRRPGQMIFDAWRLFRSACEQNGQPSYTAVGLASCTRFLSQRLENLWHDATLVATPSAAEVQD